VVLHLNVKLKNKNKMPYNKPSMKGAYMYGATKPSMKHGAHMKSKRSGIYAVGALAALAMPIIKSAIISAAGKKLSEKISMKSGIKQTGLEKLMKANPEVTKKVAASLPMKGKPAICKHNRSK